MAKKQETQQTDELFFDQLKDQFAFFYALTMVTMEAYKKARQHYQNPPPENKSR